MLGDERTAPFLAGNPVVRLHSPYPEAFRPEASYNDLAYTETLQSLLLPLGDRRTLPGQLFREGQALSVVSFDGDGLGMKVLGGGPNVGSEWTEVAFRALSLHFFLIQMLRCSQLKSIRISHQAGYDILIAYSAERYVAALLEAPRPSGLMEAG
jgi:hypothetical protein